MSDMERVLRDEIAWHEEQLEFQCLFGSNKAQDMHIARLAALTAALPAPGDAGVVCEACDGSGLALPALRADDPAQEMCGACLGNGRSMLSAAPHPPVSPAEISQAQAQAMREALLFYGGHDPDNSDHGEWVERMNEDGGDVARAALTPEPPR